MSPDDWTVLHCGPAAEFKVRDALAALRLDAYVPAERVWRGSGPRRKPHTRPLIRGYVFARLAGEPHRLHDLGHPTKIVPGNAPEAIAAFVEALKAAEAAGAYDHAKARRTLTKGDRVRIASGPFAGVTGAIARLGADRRAVVMLNAVKGISGTMTVAVERLEGV